MVHRHKDSEFLETRTLRKNVLVVLLGFLQLSFGENAQYNIDY